VELALTTTSASEERTTEQIQAIIDAVRQRFVIAQEYIVEHHALEFYVDPSQQETKENFLSLENELSKSGDSAVLRNTDHGLLLVVFRKPPRGRQRLRTPLILFVATIITIFADGYLRVQYGTSGSFPLLQGLMIGGTYAISLMGIIGIHEMGHKLASWNHKMDSSWPYFIPGIPGVWPTMGAVISARDPPQNRDALFDLGISGPIAGLLVTIIVSIFAMSTAKFGPVPSGTSVFTTDMYTGLLSNLFFGARASNPGYAISGNLFSVLYFGYSIGFILTFVNLLPAWQLDGGHVANSFVSPRVHRYLTWISAGIMVLVGFWLMAILIILVAGKAPSLRPLDDVSPLSSKRKIFFWLTWVLAAVLYIFTIFGNPYFSISQLL
jgi:Zn-dependent protease